MQQFLEDFQENFQDNMRRTLSETIQTGVQAGVQAALAANAADNAHAAPRQRHNNNPVFEVHDDDDDLAKSGVRSMNGNGHARESEVRNSSPRRR